MGMTIDEAMENLHAIQAYYNDDMQDCYIGFAKEDNESVDFAMDIMHKYQKIQEIVKNADTSSTIYSSLAFSEIKEVVEDDE